ncbi:MAG TPA: ClpXP protease specificity-enhancing factor SspB [Thermoanaerobaculia bacterium]|nr:ClpXP protease specificity-enhancing factor SspB [Thermoanaerobaculia bacterium]
MSRFDYQRMVLDALRQVMCFALRETAREGLTDGHHFLIGFRTDYPGVGISPVLRDLYPTEMKIVIQHQYWDLEVETDAFSVTLAFGGVRHRLTVPYQSVTAFVDPGAQFGLSFEPPPEMPEDGPVQEETEAAETTEEPATRRAGSVVSLAEFRKR